MIINSQPAGPWGSCLGRGKREGKSSFLSSPVPGTFHTLDKWSPESYKTGNIIFVDTKVQLITECTGLLCCVDLSESKTIETFSSNCYIHCCCPGLCFCLSSHFLWHLHSWGTRNIIFYLLIYTKSKSSLNIVIDKFWDIKWHKIKPVLPQASCYKHVKFLQHLINIMTKWRWTKWHYSRMLFEMEWLS